MIRVGRCKYDRNGKRTDPSFPGFSPIIVLMKSHSKWGVLGPYSLQDEKGRFMESIWQFSRVMSKVPKTRQTYSRYDSRVIWEWPEEEHVTNEGEPNEKYWKWREAGMNNPYAVRYPVGFHGKGKNVLYALAEGSTEKLDYIASRKKIYYPLYVKLARQCVEFKELQEKLAKGENLLIIEVDVCHQEEMKYYKEKYGVKDDFIEKDTMLVTKENINIMLNDGKVPFGHGYCLAVGLLEKDEWIQ